MKRALLLIVITIFVTAGVSVPQYTNAAPITLPIDMPHAPLAVETSPSLASIMPADTFVFAELNVPADPAAAVKQLNEFILKIGGNTPSADILKTFNDSLTRSLGRTATLEKDILSWVGDRVGLGVYYPDKQLDADISGIGTGKNLPTESFFLVSIKDGAKADTFFKELMAENAKYSNRVLRTSKARLLAGEATLWTDPKGQIVAVRWGDYAAFGDPSIGHFVDALKAKKPTLADDPMYQKVMLAEPSNGAKATSLFTIYYRAPGIFPITLAVLGTSIGGTFDSIVAELNTTPGAKPTKTPTPTPTPTAVPVWPEFLKALKGLGATAIRGYEEGKTLTIDTVSYTSNENLTKVFKLLGMNEMVDTAPPAAISLKLATMIPEHAMAVAIASNPKLIAQNFRSVANATARYNLMKSRRPLSDASANDAFTDMARTLSTGTGIDLEKDLLSWMGGDVVAILTKQSVDKTKSSTFTPSVAASYLIESTDKAATTALIEKINTAIKNALGKVPVEENGIYTVELPASTGFGSLMGGLSSPDNRFSYGLIDNVFVIGSAGDVRQILNASKQDGQIVNSAAWKRTVGLAPKAYQQFGYMNFAELPPAVSNTASDPLTTLPQLFDTGLLTSTDLGGGMNITTISIMLK